MSPGPERTPRSLRCQNFGLRANDSDQTSSAGLYTAPAVTAVYAVTTVTTVIPVIPTVDAVIPVTHPRGWSRLCRMP